MSFEINRLELVWPGKYDEDGNLIIEPEARLPFQIVERVKQTRATREAREKRVATLFDIWDGNNEPTPTEDDFKNKLIWGDNKLVMESLLDNFSGKIKLIYIDPPFAVGSDFALEVEIGNDEILKESSIIEEVAYRDTWGKGNDSYIKMIHSRLKLIHQLLAEDGALFLHCDYRTSSLTRIILDEIFGTDSYRNEIIWRKTNSPKFQSTGLGNQYDSIFVYSKSDKSKFSKVFRPFDEKSLKPYSYEDERGKYRLIEIEAQGVQRSPNRKQFEFKGRVAPYLYNINQLNEWDQNGMIYESGGGRFSKKQYLADMEGVLVSDLWVDDGVSPLQGSKPEVTGYPTQKPESLLERVIKFASNEGDLVADFFCGSGTTLAVAERLGRKWIGTDLGRFAIHTCRKRLLQIENCRPFEILNLGNYERQYWSNISFGEDLDEDGKISLLEYIAFILKLYGATAISGAIYLHGKMKSAFVHVGSVSSPVTVKEIEMCIDETIALQGKELHVLGWEWEMGLIDTLTDFAKAKGIKLIALQIPREVMEAEAARKGQIKFFELSYLESEITKDKNGNYFCTLTDFMIPNSELISPEVRKRVTKWSDYVDYWAVDWDFKNDTFMPKWMDYRTKRDRTLKLKTSPEKIDKPGTYKVMVKVVDIFGNDTTKVLELKVK